MVSHQQKNSSSSLLNEFQEIFNDELGLIKPFEANFPAASPRFFHPRPVPYALKNAVEAELDRPVEVGVLKKVDHSDWATPLVVVPKGNGKVRLCGDYKVTVNSALATD